MHDDFARIYDEFTKDVDYNSWYKFLRKYIKKGNILDIGCGTASLTKLFYEDGFDIIGLDISKSMLEVARKKASQIPYFCIDIQKNKLDKKFKYIMCNFDTVNYLKDFSSFIKHCSQMQDNNGILIFDIVSEEIFDEIFENDLFIDEEENYTAIWRHEKKKKNIHNIDIDLFIKQGELYRKYVEHYTKYIYEMEEIIEVLNNNSYILYDVAKNSKYGEARIFVIAKKREI